MTVNAVRLNHAVLFVADLERSLAFYQQAFGMTVGFTRRLLPDDPRR